jgi:hypothetical protein
MNIIGFFFSPENHFLNRGLHWPYWYICREDGSVHRVGSSSHGGGLMCWVADVKEGHPPAYAGS